MVSSVCAAAGVGTGERAEDDANAATTADVTSKNC